MIWSAEVNSLRSARQPKRRVNRTTLARDAIRWSELRLQMAHPQVTGTSRGPRQVGRVCVCSHADSAPARGIEPLSVGHHPSCSVDAEGPGVTGGFGSEPNRTAGQSRPLGRFRPLGCAAPWIAGLVVLTRQGVETSWDSRVERLPEDRSVPPTRLGGAPPYSR